VEIGEKPLLKYKTLNHEASEHRRPIVKSEVFAMLIASEETYEA
jgi:hypothetical protein